VATGRCDARVTRLAALVRRTRSSLVATVLAAGLLLATAIALAWVAGGVILDLAAPLSVPGRQAVWCGWWAAVATAVGLFLVAPAARWPLLDAVALRIERAIGDVHNQLLTVVDLARRPGPDAVVRGPDGRVLRPDMVERLLDQAQDRARGFRPARVLPWRTLLRNLAIAAAAVVALAGLHVGLGERFRVTLARLLDPTADIPPATWLQLRSPGDLDVLEGNPLDIRGSVVRGAAADVTLVLFDTDGRASRQPMRVEDDGTFVARLEGLDHPVRYRLESGSAWTRTHAIGILERPEIRSLSCRLRLPDYMRIEQPLDVAADAMRVEPPEGSTLEFLLAASGDAASGSLGLCERSLAREVVERHDDRVWFEDDLPRDAVTDAPWRWTTAQAAGGLRSFVVTGDRPVALRTRLEPLVLPRERPETRSFSLMGRADPGDPPTRLTVELEHGNGRSELLWGDAAATKPPANTRRIEAGPLPTPGEWTRLTVPLKSLGHLAGQPITGATFAIDRGRMLVDRPGWVERSEEVVSRSVDSPVGEIPLVRVDAGERGPATGRNDAGHGDDGGPAGVRPDGDRPAGGLWTAAVPVAKPIWVTPEFRSRQGHASLPAQPLEIAPTIDRPPSIVVDAMPDTTVLEAAIDLPITGSGFDDWGIDEVCVLAGPDPARLAVRQTLPGASVNDRPPRTQLAIATALSVDVLGLAAGKSTVWKLRITDTKGQVTETNAFRVTVQPPPESDIARTEVPALAQAKREALQLAREAARKADETDAKRQEVREAVEAGETPARRLVEELATRTERERRLADQLATSVQKAAAQADRGPLVPQHEKEALAELAAAARSLERQLAGSPPDSSPRKPQQPAAAAVPGETMDENPKRDAKQDRKQDSSDDADEPRADASAAAATPREQPTPKQRAEAAKAREVAEAPRQSAVTEAAATLAASLEQVERRLQAQGAAVQIDALAGDLARRAERLADQPRRQPSAEQARQEVRDVEQILGTRFPPPADRPTAASPEAATQPTPPRDETADRADRKDTTANEATAKPAATADTAMAKATDQTASQDAASQSADPKTAARPAAAQPQPGAAAAAAAASDAAAAASDAAAAAADLVKRLTARPDAGSSAQPSSAPADAPRPDGLRELLAGDEVRQALAMAERARRLQAKAAAEAEAAARAAARSGRKRGTSARDRPPATTADAADAQRTDTPGVTGKPADEEAAAEQAASEGGAMNGSTAIAPADALRGLDARQRATLYKLPPHVRDPLLDGMRQRGPEAYQGVIDSYFRRLGRDIPQ